MSIPPNIFKAYDIRGVYPTELNEETIIPIVKAIFSVLKKDTPAESSLTVVLGRDMRISSPSLFEVAKNTLVELGADVIDIGLVSTPTFYFAVFHNGYDGGIQISASHNPKEWNGLKIVKRGEKGLIKIGKSTGMEEIKMVSLENKDIPSTKKGSVIQKSGVVEEEVENALKIIGLAHFDQFKVVADAANAMGSLYIEELSKRVPMNLIKMNFELDGTFPAHQPDPLQFETLEELQKKVIAEKADFGLAPDGDGDRLFFIDEKGQVIPGTMITALVAREMLKKNPGEKILFEIRNIFTPKKIVEEFGGTYEVTKVGHALITEAMNKSAALFAGEGSGHFYFRDTGNTESQVPVILIVLKVLSEEKKPFSEIIAELKRSYESGEINYKVSNAADIIEAVKTKYQDGQIDLLDGAAITYPDWRLSLRMSNTEPLLRLNLEAYEKSVMEQKKQEVVNFIQSMAKTVESIPS